MMTHFKKKIKSFFTSINKEDFSMRIYAIVAAVIIWFIVAATIYQSTTVHIKDIPVTIATENTNADRNGLSIIDPEIPTVSVIIDGNRAVIGNLQQKDIIAKVDLSSVSTSGIYDLPIEILSANNKEFNVNSVIPATVKLNFVKVISQEFELQAAAPNVKAADGYIIETPVPSTNRITITGPEDTIKKITKCVVKCNYKNNSMVESYESANENELIIYSGNVVLDKKNLTFDQNNFTVQIPVYQKKSVKLVPKFKVPTNFPIEQLQYTIDTDEIEIAAPNNDSITEITLGVIDLNDVDIGDVKKFPITLPEGYKNLSDVDTVTVTFNSTGFARKTIDINKNDIIITNTPDDYSVNVVTSGISVTFVGPEELINDLTVQDIIAEADLSSIYDIPNNDYFNAAVKFYVQSNDCVWAVGKHTATFFAKEKK